MITEADRPAMAQCLPPDAALAAPVEGGNPILESAPVGAAVWGAGRDDAAESTGTP
jgi:hypothetical protein